MTTTLLIAQLSDSHVGTSATFLGGGIDTLAALRRAVAHVATLQPKPDFVVFTGDMTEHGTEAEYALVAQALATLPMPVYAVPGNHDDSKVAISRLNRYMPVAHDAPKDACCYAVRHGKLNLIALDTVVAHQPHGEIRNEQLIWLERMLGQCPGEPVLLFMHHPPLPTGIAAMDACSLMVGGDALAVLVQRHGCVQGVLCGHLHRSVQMQFGGVPLHVAPSVAHQITLDLMPDAPLHAQLEPPKISLHRWSSAHGLCTHTSYIDAFGAPLSF